MSEAKWQCNHCDHINKFIEQSCEICDKQRPVIKEFTYYILEEFGTIKVSWSIENFIKGNLKFGRKNIDITESKGEIVLKELRHKKKIVLNTENETCSINEEKIILLKEPEIIKFNSNILKVLENSFIDLTWETKNATNVTISTLGSVSFSGFVKSTAPKSSFKIIAENEVGKTEQELKIEVVPLPKVKEFKAKQQKIEFGKETELVWEVENVEKVELHYAGNLEVLSNKGNKVISPSENTTYKIIFTALDGITREEKSVNVQVFKRIEIETFTSDYEYIVESLPIELNWKVNNASTVKLCSNIEKEIDVTSKNKISLKPKRNQYFYLKATNDLFTLESEKINIEVQNLPTLPRFENIIPTGKELIPVFTLDFSENVNNILTESQISFQKALKNNKRFNLLATLKTILSK
jgi:hypothetical protein